MYFETFKNRLGWKTHLGDAANAAEVRFRKMKHWFIYMDKIIKEGHDEQHTIRKMEAMIASKNGMSHSVFIKDAFYYFVNPPKESTKKQPRISHTDMIALFQVAELPLP